jgi:hypothetical protein
MNSMEITTRIGCKNACTYCPQELLLKAYTKRSREFMMDFGVFQECLKKIPAKVNIHFSGMCEPWLNPECTKMVQYSHETGHRLSILTTAVGMSPSDVLALKSIPFTAFAMHLPSSEAYEKITVNDKYLSTLRCLKDTGIVTSWHCSSTTINTLVQPIVGQKVHYGSLNTRAGNLNVENTRMRKRKKGRIRCKRNLHQNVLLPNGDVLLCCMDYGMKHVIGNLREQNYESLFKSQEFLFVERGLEDASVDILCRLCDYFVEDVFFYDKVRNKFLSELLSANTPREVLALVPKVVVGIKKHLQKSRSW